MNTRERFLATINFEHLDRPLYWEFGYWVSTLRRWYKEGLVCKKGITEGLFDDATFSGECLGLDWRNPNFAYDVNEAMGFDEPIYRIPVNNMYCPAFKTEKVKEDSETYTVINTEGETVQISKINGSRHYIDYPVKTRQDYYLIREQRLQPNLSERLTKDWPQLREKLRNRTFPLMYGGNMGFFNQPRRLVGVERLFSLFYDDPELLKLMINDVVDLLIGIYEPLLSEVGGDCAMISEDMCYKGGCFISPSMFREFMLPAYKKLTNFYRDHGIGAIYIDSDGDVTGLIPLLIEGGVRGLHPFEVTGDCDIVKVRQAFPKFVIFGGIDKKMIAAGKKSIDKELESKIPLVYKTGGFIPFIDHTVPPDVSWEDFCYYRDKIKKLTKQ